MSAFNWTTFLVTAAGAACLAPSAGAQSLVSTSANVLAADGMNAPGLAGVTFGGSGNFDNPVMDGSGRVLFRARLIGTSGTTTERGLFFGTTGANLALLVQSGDAAPTLSGITLNTATGQGLGSAPRFSANGTAWFCSSLNGTGTVTSNDSAIFGGLPGNLTLFAREGDVMPGTTGATLSSSLSGLSWQPTGINDSGRLLFQSNLAGGDVNGTVNNTGWITGTPGNLEFVVRKGDTVLNGPVVSSLGFISQINPSGQVLHEETLSQTLGNPPATAADDKVLLVYTPGVGNQAVVREGDIAPGTNGAFFGVAGNTWSVSVGPASFTRDGKTLFQGALMGGNVTGPNDDTAYYIGDANGIALAVREGDPAPGTDAFLLSMHSTYQFLNNGGRIAFESALQGGSSTTADDTGIWAGLPGALELVAREGDAAPGLPGELLGSTSGQFMQFNDLGQVLFNNSPTGGSGMSALYGWTPGVGLTLVAHSGDQVEVTPGVFKTVSSFGGVQFNNGDGRGLSFGNDGRVALKVTFTDGTGAILTVQLPMPAAINYCSPGLNGVAACPCSNPPSGGGRGCDNSSATGGASISASGSASLGADTLSFTTAGEKPSATSILLSGTSSNNGFAFGQGVRCVGGSLHRLYITSATAGSVVLPGPGDASISARHAALNDPIGAGSHRYYMVYYRDPIVLGACAAAATFNGTDALDVLWTP